MAARVHRPLSCSIQCKWHYGLVSVVHTYILELLIKLNNMYRRGTGLLTNDYVECRK
jgi:hypothetical protein